MEVIWYRPVRNICTQRGVEVGGWGGGGSLTLLSSITSNVIAGNSFKKHIQKEQDSKLHCTFNQVALTIEQKVHGGEESDLIPAPPTW